eukprot:30908-Eustigmatos_ZCMA.PRE.1
MDPIHPNASPTHTGYAHQQFNATPGLIRVVWTPHRARFQAKAGMFDADVERMLQNAHSLNDISRDLHKTSLPS